MDSDLGRCRRSHTSGSPSDGNRECLGEGRALVLRLKEMKCDQRCWTAFRIFRTENAKRSAEFGIFRAEKGKACAEFGIFRAEKAKLLHGILSFRAEKAKSCEEFWIFCAERAKFRSGFPILSLAGAKSPFAAFQP